MQLERERERAVQALCAHYAKDHLTTGELERRFERVYAARDSAALDAATAGLPALSAADLPPPPPMYAPRTSAPTSGLDEHEKRYAVFFSELRKEGHWRAPQFARIRAWFGSVLLDLREAEIPPHGMEIDAETTFGEITILLPPGIGADVDCMAVLGDVKDKALIGDPKLPVVRVRGGAILGSIVVKTKLPSQESLESWRTRLRGWLKSDTPTPR